ncbi:type I restriction enzyme, S subunit [Paenimyroides aquimaris]|uniref:Type I restriction enzyme, S subunit n=1 Tax=Paenimyroides marinum TaxID=1159016 RepID=A0A1H6MLQ8_9FLAO|nr:restriction endonuclease subunit S [Paenimyroides aquimaris]SEH99456.1 type I restriction enzyme, S subunit [Paenimyroides aquimaris]
MMGEKNSLEKFGILDIPKGWQIKKLKDILIEGRLGGNYENAEANNGVPVIKMGNLDRATIKIDKIQYLPENETYNQEDVLVKGDLLFNTRNTLELVGKVAIWNNELPFAVYNSNLMRMKFDSSFVESTWFMNRAFNSYYGLRQLRGIATGTTSVAAIYGRDLESIKFLLPPLPEQKAIAQVLSTADSAIHTTEKLIAQKELRKKWLMQQLLTGKKRLKGFSGEVKIKVVGQFIKEVSERNKGLKVTRVLSVTNSRGFINQSDQFDRSVASEDASNYKIVRKGQFAYNPSRVNVGSLDLLRNFDEGILSPMYVVFSTDEKHLLADFLYFHLKTQWFYGHIPMFVQGSVRDSLSFDGLCSMKFFIPTIEEQAAIVKVLQAADKEISLLKAKAEKLREQKKGLMQVLLTGKVRLKINNE